MHTFPDDPHLQRPFFSSRFYPISFPASDTRTCRGGVRSGTAGRANRGGGGPCRGEGWGLSPSCKRAGKTEQGRHSTPSDGWHSSVFPHFHMMISTPRIRVVTWHCVKVRLMNGRHTEATLEGTFLIVHNQILT